MTTSITITKATREEIGLDESLVDSTGARTQLFLDAEEPPEGWEGFSCCDWHCSIFNTLANGVWRVIIADPNGALKGKPAGDFVVIFEDDGGLFKKS